MSISAELVQAAYWLLAGRAIEGAPAAQLATMLGTREELLARLLCQDRVLGKDDELSLLLVETARRGYSVPRLVRPERGDAFAAREHALRVAETVSALLAAEKQQTSIADAVHVSMRDLAADRQAVGGEIGYHWLPDHEHTL